MLEFNTQNVEESTRKSRYSTQQRRVDWNWKKNLIKNVKWLSSCTYFMRKNLKHCFQNSKRRKFLTCHGFTKMLGFNTQNVEKSARKSSYSTE